MSKQAHILSFDDVKRDTSQYGNAPVRAHRASDDPSRPAQNRPHRQSSPLLSYLSEDDFAYPYEDRARDGRAPSRRRSARAAQPARSRRETGERRSAASYDEPRRNRSARAAQQTEDQQETENFQSRRITSEDRRRAKAKAKAKAKAERAYTKQFGSDTPASESGPRAAVYKGEMGASQRRAQRMQENEASPSANRRKTGFSLASLSGLMQTRRFMVGAVVAACLVLSAVFLYPTAQQYYCSVRNHDKLAIEYAALAERNDALQTDVDALQTDAGVEQRAHEQLGWVKKGEETANVRGLDLDSSSDSSGFIANIASDSVQAPTTWYSPVLDVVFGYNK